MVLSRELPQPMDPDARMTAEVRLLLALIGVELDLDDTNDKAVRRAMTWCKAVGVTSVLEIVSASLSEEFVKELQLKLAPTRVLLEALRKGDVLNDGLHVPLEGFSRTATFVRRLQAGQATEQQQEALSALCEYALRVGGELAPQRAQH